MNREILKHEYSTRLRPVLKSWTMGILLFQSILCFLLLPASTLARESKQKEFSNSSCSQNEALAARVEACSKPLMDILEGKLEKWPKASEDIGNLCAQFLEAERCIRDNGRKCGLGIQRVIISTVANSIQRTRKRECSSGKYPGLLLLTKCIESNLHLPHQLMANATSRLSVVEKMQNLDRRTTGVCCSIDNLESEISRVFNTVCPNEAKLLIRLYRSVLQDVHELVCPNPKCTNPFEGYVLPAIEVDDKNDKGIISYLLRIVFSLAS